MKSIRKNHLISDHLCTRCGACTAVCPPGVLDLTEDLYPYMQYPEKCVNCRACFNVCPGLSVDFTHKNGGAVNSPYIGNYINLFEGMSRERDILENCTSGGCVTSLVSTALGQKEIDGAITVSMSATEPTKSSFIMVTNSTDAKRTGQSKYQITSLAKIIPEIQKFSGIAFVGLGCHIHAMKKIEELLPHIKERIKIYLGLFCNGICEYNGTRFLLKKIGAGANSVEKLEYRHGNWPGSLRVNRHKKDPIVIPRNLYAAFLYPFLAKRCLYCIDFTNEMADISFGDAKISNATAKGRYSQVIVRTARGKEFLNKFADCLMLCPITETDITAPQRFQFDHKKKGAFIRMFFLQKKPEYTGYSAPLLFNSSLVDSAKLILKEFRFFVLYKSRNIFKFFISLMPIKFVFFISSILFARIRRNKL